MSAEISTLVQPDSVYLGTLTILSPAPSAAVTVVAPAPAEPVRPDLASAGHAPLEPLVDGILRLLWTLVGVYVWIVLLIKGPPSRSVGRELEPIIWPQADFPPVGLPALGLTNAGTGIHR